MTCKQSDRERRASLVPPKLLWHRTTWEAVGVDPSSAVQSHKQIELGPGSQCITLVAVPRSTEKLESQRERSRIGWGDVRAPQRRAVLSSGEAGSLRYRPCLNAQLETPSPTARAYILPLLAIPENGAVSPDLAVL